MISRREAAVSLYAAWRLLLRDPDAIERFENSTSGVIKSFSCAFIVLPAYALIVAYSPTMQETRADLFTLMTVELAAYVIGWAAWPLAMHYIAPVIGRDDAYCRYVSAYNWSSGPFVLILLVLHIPVFFDASSQQFLAVTGLLALIVALLYHLFVVQVALRVRPSVAVGLVAAETFLSHLISSLRDAALA